MKEGNKIELANVEKLKKRTRLSMITSRNSSRNCSQGTCPYM